MAMPTIRLAGWLQVRIFIYNNVFLVRFNIQFQVMFNFWKTNVFRIIEYVNEGNWAETDSDRVWPKPKACQIAVFDLSDL
jgi:hypothetical protein